MLCYAMLCFAVLYLADDLGRAERHAEGVGRRAAVAVVLNKLNYLPDPEGNRAA